MKVQWHLLTRKHRHVDRQKVIQRPHQSVAGNGMLCFHADAIIQRMNAGVGSATPLNIGAASHHLCHCLLKDLLHRHGVLLYLPTVVVLAVVAQS